MSATHAGRREVQRRHAVRLRHHDAAGPQWTPSDVPGRGAWSRRSPGAPGQWKQ